MAGPKKERPKFVEGEVLIKFKARILPSQAQSVIGQLGGKVSGRSRVLNIHRVKLPPQMGVQNAMDTVVQHPAVEYVEPNYLFYADEDVTGQIVPNDPRFSEMYNLDNRGQAGGTVDADIDAPEAWDIQTGDPSVVIAVIDSGLDWSHEDISGAAFPGNLWINSQEIADNGIDDDGNGFIDDIVGWDFANDDNDPVDDNGHGTHVAGIIGAMGQNGVGISGILWDVQIMPLKFLNMDGIGSAFSAIQAIGYAIEKGARLINSSWGGPLPSVLLRDAIAIAGDAGMLFIAAAGNEGGDNDAVPFFPASYDLDHIISVAATNRDDGRASFSNYGKVSVDLGAPGADILSTLPGNRYGSLSGTSMAAPHVSGVAGLVWAEFPSLTHLEVRALLRERVDWVPDMVGQTVTWGRLNAAKALTIPSVETTLTCDSAVLPSENLVFTINISNRSAGTQDFFYLLFYIFPDGTHSVLAGTESSGFPPGQSIDIPITFPLASGWPLGKQGLRSVVLQPIPGLVIDSSICEFNVQ